MLLAPAAATAQRPPAAPSPARLEVSAGVGWFTSSSLGDGRADLRGRGGGDFALFATESRFGAGPVLDVRAAYSLTSRYSLEGRFGFSRPELQTEVSADAEGAPTLTLSERLDRYIADAALVVSFGDIRRDRLVPFASAGAGYLRELHEGRTLVEQGIAWHAGGGVRRALFTRQRRAIESIGVRGDARFYFLTEGAAGDAVHVSLTGGLFLRF
jgi:hypothetical protein